MEIPAVPILSDDQSHDGQCVWLGKMKGGESNWKDETMITLFIFWPFTLTT